MNFSVGTHKMLVSPPVDQPAAACVCTVRISRRLTSLFAALLLVACGEQETGVSDPALTIYSPAPPTIMLHRHNAAFGELLAACGIENTVVPLALPQSINRAASMTGEEKKNDLPIVTTIDFLPAVEQGGPQWHAYDRANSDLKFVASLYDVVFGVLAFNENITSPSDLKGKRIGAPPRPSAVRLYTEALLQDGWGIIDDVEIIDMRPPDLADAIANKTIDATTWNLISISEGGLEAMAPGLLDVEGARWIAVGEASVRAINAANVFKVENTRIENPEGEETGLLSFRQALAAWDATPNETVSAILACMEQDDASNIFPSVASEMAHWPDLAQKNVHAAALEFYSQRGVVLD